MRSASRVRQPLRRKAAVKAARGQVDPSGLRRSHVHHEETHSPQNGAEGRRSEAGAAVSRSHGARRHGAGPDGRGSQDAGGLLLHSPRRHHVQHVARPGHGQVDAQRRRRRFQAQPDSRFARAVQEVHHVFRQPGERGHRGLGSYVQSRDVAQRHASGHRRSHARTWPPLSIR